jgi:hypothetical protein
METKADCIVTTVTTLVKFFANFFPIGYHNLNPNLCKKKNHASVILQGHAFGHVGMGAAEEFYRLLGLGWFVCDATLDQCIGRVQSAVIAEPVCFSPCCIPGYFPYHTRVLCSNMVFLATKKTLSVHRLGYTVKSQGVHMQILRLFTASWLNDQ